MKLAIAPTDETTLLTCEYDPPTGLAWAILHDNPLMAWLVDPDAVEPPAPVILGSLPPAPPETAAVVSPAWAFDHQRHAVRARHLAWLGAGLLRLCRDQQRCAAADLCQFR